ncbi:Uncharacterised protein [Mycobacteroides abscessus subsp. abscessus]|nr:Uncharacterised protein [Mycobacteroides abscessus subsp. abscessus]
MASQYTGQGGAVGACQHLPALFFGEELDHDRAPYPAIADGMEACSGKMTPMPREP